MHLSDNHPGDDRLCRPGDEHGLPFLGLRAERVTFASYLGSIRAVASTLPGSIVFPVCLSGVALTSTSDGRVAFRLLAEEKTPMRRRNGAIAMLTIVQTTPNPTVKGRPGNPL
jgi:hypothetical protein